MTSPTASEMGKRRQQIERRQLGEAAYLRHMRELAAAGGRASKGKPKTKRKPAR